ncbi:S-adenosylmethionine:tRNA ribosyltransferase-isomerase [Caldimonas brevitalea]|uniref:S-adenosylmethionine:tRNA ribosyltransferase-isomerase n=1 Tax=Caldimonas brevitalea TaxID=413882 RepID=A0A0G3BVM9_9BURK|nr:S-adenosylmethionine:tRNA ribosyltransferase-isomerase [Caldimonas brevitalea]AKJ31426.1 S-adenosylmethionine:tRNA ribosyltransferase-isomerase [Caldimonas brevitalea]
MIAADQAVQRPADARLLVIAADGSIRPTARSRLIEWLRPGDLLVANDAATLPASLFGTHEPSGGAIEVRLAGRDTLDPRSVSPFTAVVFGAGDHRARTEDRAPPPTLRAGDRLLLGPLDARVDALLGHARLLTLRFAGTPAEIWAGLARHGRPVQYAHVPMPLALWDVWTPIAGLPVAFEPPSAGFALDWRLLSSLRARGVAFSTLTHAAGLSSTGDLQLDRRLPLPEAYRIPKVTAEAIAATRRGGGRVVAVGTTVVRALEQAWATHGTVPPGDGLATLRIGSSTRLQVVDVLLSGTHEPDTSHHALLRAFTDDTTLRRADRALEAEGFRTHEFGDSVWLERRDRRPVNVGPGPGATGVRPADDHREGAASR